MAQVTLRDLSTNEEIVVPPEGFMFGRVGGDADIQLEDNSISRRQARVSFKGGQWLFETLAVPQGQRAPRPQQLQPGATFAVGQTEFEVLEVDAEAVDEEGEADPGAKTFAPQKGKPGPAPVAAAKKAAAPGKSPTAPQQKRAPTAAAAPAADEAPPASIGALFVGVPKGIAYYLLNVPKLLVNPVGTVRRQIDELPAEPMGRTELIGFALPSLFVSALLPSIAAGLGLLIGPTHTFSFSAFVPIGPAIGAVVGALISGWFFHPVTEWIITKLKGSSDARSRSNYFLQMMTLAIILAVPQALSVLLALVPIPFINLLGPLLSMVGSLVSLYVAYQWVVKFELVKWMQMVVKVLAVLTLVGTGFGLISAAIASVRAFTSGGSSSSAAVAAATDTDDTAAAADDLGEMPQDPAEAAEWSKKRAAQLQAKALEQQKKAMDAAKAQADDAQAKADDAVKTAKKDAPPEPKKKDEPKAKPEPEPEPVKVATPEPANVRDTPPPPANDPAPSGSGGYAAFARKRDAIEKLFENDPTVLQKSAEMQKLYGAYTEDAYELDKKWGKETAKKPERAKLNAHLKDAELYGRTSKTIDALAGKLGVR